MYGCTRSSGLKLDLAWESQSRKLLHLAARSDQQLWSLTQGSGTNTSVSRSLVRQKKAHPQTSKTDPDWSIAAKMKVKTPRAKSWQHGRGATSVLDGLYRKFIGIVKELCRYCS